MITINKFQNYTVCKLSLLIISLLSIIGATVYKLYALNWSGTIISLLVLATIIYCLRHRLVVAWPEFKRPAKITMAELLFGLLWLVTVWFVFKLRTGEPIVSPWTEISPLFFICFGCLTVSLFYLSVKSGRWWTLAVWLYLFVCYFVAVIVYRLGYGFDPFIHQATLKYINDFGAITPKTLYYSGQYGLEIIINKLTFIPLPWLDKLLLPTLAMIFLPLACWQNFNNIFHKQVSVRPVIIILAVALTPLFFLTLPQNMAYLFLILLVVYSLSAVSTDWLLMYALAGAAMVTQPVAGIPALMAVGILQLYHSSIQYRRIFITAGLTVLAIVLPLSFFLIDKSYSPDSHLNLNRFDWSWLLPSLPNDYGPWLNFAQGWQSCLPIIVLLLVALGYLFNRRQANHYRLYWWLGLAMVAAYLLTKTIGFSFLIDYERDNYAQRMLIATVIFWLPLIAIGLYEIVSLILTTDRRQKISWAIVGACFLTAGLYVSYPRLDKYVNAHGYATSVYDLAAVNWIDQDAVGKDYIVLADQQVSAASLRRFGFAKYYQKNIFYYPIPTGGPLYQYYLAVTNEPGLAIIKTAGQMVGVKLVYVVINDYWWQSQRLTNELGFIADEQKSIGDGQVSVFKFVLN